MGHLPGQTRGSTAPFDPAGRWRSDVPLVTNQEIKVNNVQEERKCYVALVVDFCFSAEIYCERMKDLYADKDREPVRDRLETGKTAV